MNTSNERAPLNPTARPDLDGGAAVEPTPRLALRPRDAAQALGIGTRLLWTLTNRGEIPHVRLGAAVLYPVEALRRFLAEAADQRRRDGAGEGGAPGRPRPWTTPTATNPTAGGDAPARPVGRTAARASCRCSMDRRPSWRSCGHWRR